MEKVQIQKIYSRYAAVYDLIFSHLFGPRIKVGIEKIGIRKGDRIIEVGVGTGLSLDLYPPWCRVTGIDITRRMLEQAQKKKEKHNLEHVDLVEMDAENLAFADNSFDHAVIPFVVSVVADPEKMVSEVKRITRDGGKIIVINHFRSNCAFLEKVEKFFSPLFLRLGWRAALPLELLSNHCNMHITDITRKYSLDPWIVIRALNSK